MSKQIPRGRFVWFELLTSDTDAAQRFYTRLIGWDTASWRTGEQPYTLWTLGERRIGGLMKLPEQAGAECAPPHWLGYVSTPGADATLALATKLGARTLLPATDIPDVGRVAVIADPQGAVIGIYTPNETPEDPGDRGPAAGEVSWHELMTTDHFAAFPFYEALFGWRKSELMDMGEAGLYQLYGREGRNLGGMYNKPRDVPGPAAWLYYIYVDDVNERAKNVEALGGKVLNGPMEVPGGDLIAQCLDPQGAAFALHSLKKSPVQ